MLNIRRMAPPLSQGFEWINDAEVHRAKWGYKADKPGAELVIAFNATSVIPPSVVSAISTLV